MRIHAIGPRTELAFPKATATAWSNDYGARSFVERDRPYFDDQPAGRHGWETLSRWGSRPIREFDTAVERGGTMVTGFFRLAWKLVTNAVRNGG